MGHRSHQQRDWSTVEDDGWKVDSGQTRSSCGLHSNPSVARFREHESRGRESPSKTLMSSEPRSDAKAAMPSKTTKERRLTQIAADCESNECLRNTPHGAERLDRRNEVINEALADEVRMRRAEEEQERRDHSSSTRNRTSSSFSNHRCSRRSNRSNNKPRSRPSKRKPRLHQM